METLKKLLGIIVVLLGVICLALYHFKVVAQENSILFFAGVFFVLGVVLHVIFNKKVTKE